MNLRSQEGICSSSSHLIPVVYIDPLTLQITWRSKHWYRTLAADKYFGTINCLILYKDHLTDLSNGYKNIVNNGLSKVCKIKVKENRMGKSRIDRQHWIQDTERRKKTAKK